MPLSESEYRALIIHEVGDSPSGIIAANIDTYWALHDDQPTLKLHYLYTKLKAIDVLMGTVREQVNQVGLAGAGTELHQKIESLALMRAATLDDIGRAGLVAQGTTTEYGPAIGLITATSPLAAPEGWPDASDPFYRGSVYGRRG